MKDFVNSSALTKMLAAFFVFAILMACAGLAVYNKFNNQPIDPSVMALLVGGLTSAMGILGVHVGGQQALQAQQQVQNQVSVAPAPMKAVLSPATPPMGIPYDPQATQQRPAIQVVPGNQTRSTNAIS